MQLLEMWTGGVKQQAAAPPRPPQPSAVVIGGVSMGGCRAQGREVHVSAGALRQVSLLRPTHQTLKETCLLGQTFLADALLAHACDAMLIKTTVLS